MPQRRPAMGDMGDGAADVQCRFMRRICCVLPLLAIAGLAAEKKPVTIQNMPAPVHMPRITWAPDGKRFAWMEKTVKPPKQEGVDWQNRRVSEQSFQWSSTGQEMLIRLEGDLILMHTDTGK